MRPRRKITVWLHTYKTINTGNPKPLFQAISSVYTYTTRGAASAQIRQDETTATASFKFRAREYYSSVPVGVRTGSLATVKRKLNQYVKTNIPID